MTSKTTSQGEKPKSKKRGRKPRRGRGEGSISQRPGGGWYAQKTVGFSPAGKQIRKTVSGKTKSEVFDKLTNLHVKHVGGTLANPTSTIKVQAFLERWLRDNVTNENAGSTLDSYARNFRLWVYPQIGSLDLETLTDDNVKTLLQHMQEEKKSNRTRQYVRGILSTALDWAAAKGLIKVNPCNLVARPSAPPPEFDVYNEDETIRFINACQGERLGALWVTAVLTGMRIGELLAIKWTDIDFRRKVIHVRRTQSIVKKKVVIKEPKTATGKRAIDLTEESVQWLIDHKAAMLAEGNLDQEWVFCERTPGTLPNRFGAPLSTFNRIVRRAGLKRIRPHDLRHTHATLLLKIDTNAKVVSERLGHTSVAFTLRIYSHVLPRIQAEAAAKLGKLLRG